MREFLLNNKGKFLRVIVLLFVFFLIVAFINGRNIYKEKTKRLQDRTVAASWERDL
jgi:hypothetical protein